MRKGKKNVNLLFRCNSPFVKEEGAFARAIEAELLTFDFMSLCVWLITELKKVCPLGESLTGIAFFPIFCLSFLFYL